jgi:hypothetical protein
LQFADDIWSQHQAKNERRERNGQALSLSRENDSDLETKKTNTTIETTNMKYALFVFQPQELFERRDSAMAAAGKTCGEALRAAGVVVTAAGLQPPQSATMVSVRDGKRQVHDGSYAETKEFLGGFVNIDVPNIEAALEWAARHPAAAASAVELRPLFAYS